MKPENILVTGGSGMVGRNLQPYLPTAKYISSKECDLENEQDCIMIVSGKKRLPGYNNILIGNGGWNRIIHCGAKVGGLEDNMKYQYDYWEQNNLMNTLLLKYALIAQVPCFTAILSTCIFPNVATSYPMREEQMHESAPSPSNYGYAIAKRALASGIDCCNQQYGTKYNYLIPCNLYGKYDKTGSNSHYVASLIKKIYEAQMKGENHITLQGNGKPIRQFMLADDFARVIKLMVERDVTENFNVCPDELYTIHEIAEIALEACDAKHFAIKYERPELVGQFRKDADNSKFKSLFPDFKFTSLHDGIKSTYEFYKKQI